MLRILLLTFILAACRMNEDAPLSGIKRLDASQLEDTTIYMSSLIEKIETIPLIDSTHHLQRFDQMIEGSRYLYFLDKSQSYCVFIFDAATGSLAKKLDGSEQVGRAILFRPTYLQLNTNGNLEILDQTKKIYVYDGAGNFLRTRVLSFRPMGFFIIDSVNYAFYNAYVKNMYLLSDEKAPDITYNFLVTGNDDIRYKSFSFDTKLMNVGSVVLSSQYFFASFNRNLLIQKGSNIIFEFDKDRIQPYLYIDFGKTAIPEFYPKHPSISDSLSNKLFSGKYNYLHEFFYENDSIILFQYVHERGIRLCVYDKKKVVAKRVINLINDKDDQKAPGILYCQGDRFYSFYKKTMPGKYEQLFIVRYTVKK
jgi:hypothetical protein